MEKIPNTPPKSKREEIWEMAEDMLNNKVVNRGLDAHLNLFNLSKEELDGKRILDMGSKLGYFARDAEREGIDVTALDLLYVDDKGREAFLKDREETEPPRAVAALAQNLPFPKNTFDLATSLYSAVSYAKSVGELKQILKEGLRVLKKKGKMLVFPAVVYGDEVTPVIFEAENSTQLGEAFYKMLVREQEKGKLRFGYGFPQDPDEDFQCYIEIEKLR